MTEKKKIRPGGTNNLQKERKSENSAFHHCDCVNVKQQIYIIRGREPWKQRFHQQVAQQSGSEYVTTERCRKRDFHIRVPARLDSCGGDQHHSRVNVLKSSADEPFDLRSLTDGNGCKTGSTCWVFSGRFCFLLTASKTISFPVKGNRCIESLTSAAQLFLG